MYIFDLWIRSERERIARAELLEAWDPDIPQDERFDRALTRVTHNIHPLCILGLRRHI